MRIAIIGSDGGKDLMKSTYKKDVDPLDIRKWVGPIMEGMFATAIQPGSDKTLCIDNYRINYGKAAIMVKAFEILGLQHSLPDKKPKKRIAKKVVKP
jgi:hypothetical protein